MPKLRIENGKFVVDDFKLNLVNQMFLETDSKNYLDISIILHDKRLITDQQRKFIFALCNEISFETGEDSEYLRLILQQYNANLRDIQVESLSNCSMTYANGLIDTIIEFCIEHEIPISGDVISDHKYKFNEHQVYMMCLKRICVVCGKRADIHHVDHIGRGYNRNKISHVGKRALPLCRKCHTDIHTIGEEKYIEMNHLTPIVIDEKMEYFIKRGKIKYFKEEKRRKQKC